MRWRDSAYHPVVAHPVLRRLIPAFAVSAVGDGMSTVAIAWLAIRLASPGDRGLVVGVAVAAYTLPGAAGAVLLTRLLRRLPGARLVTADASLRAAALGAVAALYTCGVLHAGSYVALLAVSSLLHAWGLSGQYTLVAEHLPDEHRTAGNALLSGFGMVALVIGPLLAGLAVAFAGPAVPIGGDAATFAVLAVTAGWPAAQGQPMAQQTAHPAEDQPGGETEPRPAAGTDAGPRERATGFAVIAGSPPLAGLLALTLAYFFLYGPVEVALPLYVTGTLHGGAGLLGLFWTVFGVGATAGAVATGLVRRFALWPVLLAAVVGWGAALAPLGLVRLTVPALAGFALGGLLYAPYPALSATLFQRESPPELLSQVLAARGALTVLATPLGTALGGPLTTWIGAQRTLLVSAIATIAVGLAAAAVLGIRVSSRARRHMFTMSEPEAEKMSREGKNG